MLPSSQPLITYFSELFQICSYIFFFFQKSSEIMSKIPPENHAVIKLEFYEMYTLILGKIDIFTILNFLSRYLV